jgi:monoamine oxidase
MIEDRDENKDLSSPTGGQGAYDVVIIGAGAAGLMAAWEIIQTGKKVTIIEARDRIGGRIHTIYDTKFSLPIEAGAEFVHGDLPLTKLLLKKAGIAYSKVEGGVWRKEKNGLQKSDFIEDYRDLNKKFKELKNDISIGDFMSQYLNEPKYEELRKSLKSYVEGYYAADTAKASTFALRDELRKSSDEQYRVESGYQTLVDFLHTEFLQKNGNVHYSSPVSAIDWHNDDVKVITAQKLSLLKK